MAQLLCSWDSVSNPEVNSYTTGNSQESLPGITVPLTADLMREWTYICFQGAAEYYRATDLIPDISPPNDNIFSFVGGRWVVNIAVVNAFSSLYQVGEGSDWLKQFLPGEEELKSGSEKDQERAQLTRERALNRWRESRYFTIREAAEAHASYLFSRRRDWSLLEDIELLEAIEATTLRLGEAYRTHYFNTVGGGELTTIVSEVLDTNFPDHAEEWITVLTSGLSNVESNRPTKAIWDVSREIVESPILKEAFKSLENSSLLKNLSIPSDPVWELFAKKFSELRDDLGFRGQGELDPYFSTWDENPEFIVSSLKSAVFLNEDRNPYIREVTQTNLREELEAQIISELPESIREEFKENLVLAQRLNRDREASKANGVRYSRTYRPPIRELGIRLKNKRLLKDDSDVWWLRLEELRELVKSEPFDSAIQGKVQSRKEEFGFLEKHDLPILFEWPVELVPLEFPDVIKESLTLQGMGVSKGTVTGKARIVKSALAVVETQLEPGEILVAPVTDAGWTPLFVSAGGVVVETGGMLSHAATVAREYGLPAVVNIEGATSIIPEGAMLSIDGATGKVDINF